MFGGGLELALACDIRIAVPSASIGAPAGRLGLVYSPGGLERLITEIPFAVVADMFLTGGTIDVQRAYELGVISRIVDPEELQDVAIATAIRVALAPTATRANRRALRLLRRSRMPLSDGVRGELLMARREGMGSADFAEGVAAFREHRPPRFTGG